MISLATILAALPSLIALGTDVASLIGKVREHLNSKADPTPEEWAALHAMEAAWQADIDKRLKG